MTGTKYQILTALLAGALPVFTGCVMEHDMEPGDDRNELVGAASLPPADPCNSPFSHNPERTLALPLLMSKSGSSSRLPVDTGWYTNVVIQNTSSTLATVRLRAVPSTPGPEFCTIFSLGSETAVIFRADNLQAAGTVVIAGFPVGTFEGSMFIETDQRLAAVVKLSNVPLGSMGRPGGTAAGAYQGLSMKTGSAVIGQELAYPIMKSGFNGSSTTLFVQNQNVESRGDRLHMQVRTNDSKMYTYSADVQGGQSVAIHPGQFTDATGKPMPAACPSGGGNAGQPGAPCFGAVRIVPFGARFGAIAVEHSAGSVTPAILVSQFENVSQASHQQWLPVVKNQYQGASSGIGIMNVSSEYQDITVILRKQAVPQSAYSYTFDDVPPFRSVVASPFANTFGDFPAGEVGVAEIRSTGPITAVVNEANGSGSASSYHGQSVPGDLAAPLNKIAWFGRRTKTTLWNVGSQAVEIVARYKCRTATSGTYSDHMHTMTAEAGVAVNFEPINIPAGNLCSAIFTTAQGTLVGTVSEESIATPALEEGSTYEAIVLD